MFNSLGIAILLMLALLQRHGAECNAHQRKLEKQIIDNVFSSTNYDPRVRPSGVNSSSAFVKPLEVVVNMYVRKIHRLDDDKMLFSLDTTFRQMWVDERLKFNAINGVPHLNLNDDDDLWTPGLFFNDYKGSTHDVTTPNILVRLWPNGTVMHSKRYNLMLYCDMDFHDFPFDVQTCNMTIAAYAYRSSDIVLKWRSPDEEAIFIAKSLINDGLYTLKKFDTIATSSKTSTGEYSKLVLSLDFQRVLPYYGIQIFIPCFMMTIAGYLPFWIGMKHFNARIILAVATCYTLAVQISNFNIDLPRTSYTKAVDVFTGMSLTFTFATVIETIVVYVLTAHNQESIGESLIQSSDGSSATHSKSSDKTKRMREWLRDHSDSTIDVVAKIAYPVVYLVFSIVYWGYYL